MTTTFVSYCRVSTTRQGTSGLGLAAQQQAVVDYVAARGGEIVRTFVEVESGAAKRRPELHLALAHCRRAKSVLVIAKLDRLARNVAFIATLMEAGVEFVAVDAPYANKLMLHILAAFAEHEREQISARTKAALGAAKARGVRLGANGVVLAEANRAGAIRHAITLGPTLLAAERAGCRTLRAKADFFNHAGLTTREGAQWQPATIARLERRLVAIDCNAQVQAVLPVISD